MIKPMLQAKALSPRLLVPWLLILASSLLMLYSVTSPPGDSALENGREAAIIGRGVFYRQLIWTIVGLAAMLAGSMIPFWIYKDYLARILYGAGMAVLLALLVLPPMQGGTHRWLALGPLSMQPSEPFKAVLIMMLCSFLAEWRGDPDRFSLVWLVLAFAVPPALLILKQPDLGTAMTLLWLPFPLLFWRGLSLRRLLVMMAPFLSAFIILYGQSRGSDGLGGAHILWGVFMVGLFVVCLLSPSLPLRDRVIFFLASVVMGLAVPWLWDRLLPYQQKRILVFFDPNLDPLGAGYQILQSKVAIGSGGFLGRGFLEGTQKGLAFLPARHTDFIFSVVGEEFGFLGALAVILFYGFLILEGIRLAGRARHPFGQLLAVGISSLLLFHLFVNTAMTMGLAPVTGVPLPGLSAGGSALVTLSFLVGLQMNIARNFTRY